MADQSTQSIVIDAAPADIMAVISNFPAYPDWAASVRTCEVVETLPNGQPRLVHFVIEAGVVKDDYVLRYDWEPSGHRVSWELASGQMQKSQHGSYTLEPLGVATKVTYSLTVELAIPMLGMFKRKAEKVIMDTALKELKRRVEG